MEQILNYLKECGTFFLATSDQEQPRVRPFGAVADLDGKLYITTNNQKKVYTQMLKNPRIEISAMGSKGTWIRLEATATIYSFADEPQTIKF